MIAARNEKRQNFFFVLDEVWNVPRFLFLANQIIESCLREKLYRKVVSDFLSLWKFVGKIRWS